MESGFVILIPETVDGVSMVIVLLAEAESGIINEVSDSPAVNDAMKYPVLAEVEMLNC